MSGKNKRRKQRERLAKREPPAIPPARQEQPVDRKAPSAMDRTLVELYITTGIGVVQATYAMNWWLRAIFIATLGLITADLAYRSPWSMRFLSSRVRISIALTAIVIVSSLSWTPLRHQFAEENASLGVSAFEQPVPYAAGTYGINWEKQWFATHFTVKNPNSFPLYELEFELECSQAIVKGNQVSQLGGFEFAVLMKTRQFKINSMAIYATKEDGTRYALTGDPYSNRGRMFLARLPASETFEIVIATTTWSERRSGLQYVKYRGSFLAGGKRRHIEGSVAPQKMKRVGNGR
jgi:hypothetical protein